MGLKAKKISKAFAFASPNDVNNYTKVLEYVIHKRYLFNTRYQIKNETTEEFVTALHTLAETCEFGSIKDELIRDRIVVEFTDPEISKQLQPITGLTLQKAINSVNANEDIEKQQKAQRIAKEGDKSCPMSIACTRNTVVVSDLIVFVTVPKVFVMVANIVVAPNIVVISVRQNVLCVINVQNVDIIQRYVKNLSKSIIMIPVSRRKTLL